MDALSTARFDSTRNRAIASSRSSQSVKLFPVQRPRGSWRRFVCVSICVYVQIWGTACSHFSIFGQQQKSKHLFFFLSLSFSSCLYSIDTHPAQVWLCVFVCLCECVLYFCLYSPPAATGDSWSLAVCVQGRVRMRTACVCRLGEQC